MPNWEPIFGNAYKKSYKNLDYQIQKRVDTIVQEMLDAERPEDFGVYKARVGSLVCDINKSYRLIYDVNRKNNTLELMRVCDHKSAYMSD